MVAFYITLLSLITLTPVTADYRLTIQMKSFQNPYSLTINGLPSSNTVTLFHFCLKSETSSSTCLAEFETDILGAKSISTGQFKLTTDLIELRVPSGQETREFVLVVSALASETRLLVSEFTVEVNLKEMSKWQAFSARNNLDQQLEVDYKLGCAEFFEGNKCQKRKYKL